MLILLLKINIMADRTNIDFIKEIQKQAIGWNNYLKQAFRPLSDYVHIIQESFKQAPESIRILAENGWYVPMDLDFADVNYIADLLRQGKIDQADKILIEYFDRQSSFQQLSLIEKFSERKEILTQAFKAHNNCEYYLSVPVFYMQAEGISKKLTDTRFFSSKKHKPQTQRWSDRFKEDSMMNLLLEPLKHININRQKQITNNPIGINRHDILHGDSLDYGSDSVNSYKSFSLLWYIGETVLESTKTKDIVR